jgi:hypothetical protein
VELEPLSEDGIGEMLAAILGPDDVDRELHELMLERTEGNPFILEEMLREVVESSGSGDGGDRVAVGTPGCPNPSAGDPLPSSGGDERSAVLGAAAAGPELRCRDAARRLGEPSACSRHAGGGDGPAVDRGGSHPPGSVLVAARLGGDLRGDQ